MKKELLAAGIILAACLPSISTEASTNRILISSPIVIRKTSAIIPTSLWVWLAGNAKSRKPGTAKRNDAAMNTNPKNRNAVTVNAGNARKKRNVSRRTATIKKIINVKTTAILNVSANGNSTLPNRAGKATKATLCKIKTAGEIYHLLFFSNEII